MNLKIQEIDSAYSSFVKELNEKIDMEARSARNLPPLYYYAFKATDQDKEIGGIFGFDIFGALHIDGLWVDPLYRRKGIGRSLVQEAEKLALRRQCKCIALFTMDFQAPEFYRALGFKEEFKRSSYHKGAVAIYLVKNL